MNGASAWPALLSWRQECVRALLVALIPMSVVLGFLAAFDWFTLIDDDGLCQYQPLLSEALSRLYRGDLPFWSHRSGCGYPLFARAAVLYPPLHVAHGLCAVFGLAHREIALAHWLHLGAAAAAAYLYLRVINSERWAAALAAGAYSLTGPMLGMATNWNEYCFLMVYIPLAFLVIEEIVSGNRSWFWTLLAGLIGSLVVLGSGLLGAFKYCLLFGMYFLCRTRRETFVFSMSRFAIAALLALAGCGGPLLAGKELTEWSTRISSGGLTPDQGLGVMACAPEFFRGFVYPLVEFDWVTGNDWSRLFNGTTLFAGPLAIFAAVLSLIHFRGSPAPQRALLILLVVYGLLALGWYWPGNYLLHPLPFFKQHRWPVRWAVEVCGLAALLCGPALTQAWRLRHEWSTRAAALLFVFLVLAAVTVRTPLSTDWEVSWRWVGLVWIMAAVFFTYILIRGSEATFFVLAFAFTLAGLALSIPGAQRQRWAALRPMLNDPIQFPEDGHERILYLATRAEQRGLPGEGNLSYCFPHQFGNRTVLTYGPLQLKTQVWMAGINSQGEIEDQATVARAFLQGRALATLRVGRVVVDKENEALNAACRAHPDLKFESATKWKNVYHHSGFRAPAFFVRELVPESTITTTETVSQAALPDVGFIQDDFPGPRKFSSRGTIRGFAEQHGQIGFQTDSAEEQFAVVTTTWYPGWHATLDGQPWPLYRANGSFLAVQVPAGIHDVRLYFRPARIVWLARLNAVALAAMIGFCGFGFCQRLRQEKESNLP